jgi:hypothetical protein
VTRDVRAILEEIYGANVEQWREEARPTAS